VFLNLCIMAASLHCRFVNHVKNVCIFVTHFNSATSPRHTSLKVCRIIDVNKIRNTFMNILIQLWIIIVLKSKDFWTICWIIPTFPTNIFQAVWKILNWLWLFYIKKMYWLLTTNYKIQNKIKCYLVIY